MELLWRAEQREVRRLYQGILQIGVAFHHPRRRNYHVTVYMAYEAREILPKRFAADMTHIALGTVAEVDALVSWNFKHIVRLEKIRLFNELNVELGYRVLSILSLNPSEFLELPEPRRAALRRRGCTIPQVYMGAAA